MTEVRMPRMQGNTCLRSQGPGKRHAGLKPPPELLKKGVEERLKLGTKRGDKQEPFSREPSPAPVPQVFYGTVGERGLAHGAWRAITTSGVLELSPAPWRLCPTWNRPGVRLELSPGTPPWRWSYLRPPMCGDRDRPQQGGCPEKPKSNHT